MLSFACLCLFITVFAGNSGNCPLIVLLNKSSHGGTFVVTCGVVRYVSKNH